MTTRSEAAYIEALRPGYLRAVANDFARTAGRLRATLPTLLQASGRAQWQGVARAAYQRRMDEALDLAEGLSDGFGTAAAAVADYAETQVRAQARLADGITAESRASALEAAARPAAADAPVRAARIRDLWEIASVAYADAIRIETAGHTEVAGRLTAARGRVPELVTDPALSAAIVTTLGELPDPTAQRYRLGRHATPPIQVDVTYPYDPTAVAMPEDYASWAKWEAMRGAAALGRPDLDDALAFYNHYRDGTGTPMTFDFEEAYAEDSAVRDTVHAEVAAAQHEAERIFQATGRSSFEMTGAPSTSDWLTQPGSTVTEDWQKTVGTYTVHGTAEVVVDGRQVTMRLVVHAADFYDFNGGNSDVATGISDDENGRFAILGWATGFPVSGSLERTVTWTLGTLPAAPVPAGP